MKKFLMTLITLSVFSATAQSLRPGVWKGRVSFKVDGIPMPPTEDEDCILPSEARDVKGSIVKNLTKKGCELTSWNVEGQNLTASLKCKSDEINAKGKLKGHFSKEDYTLKGDARGKYRNMLPTVATVELRGKWVKACDENID